MVKSLRLSDHCKFCLNLVVLACIYTFSGCFYLLNWLAFLILNTAEDGAVVSCISINQSVLYYYAPCCSALYPGSMMSVYLIDFNRIALWTISFNISVGVVWLSCNKPVWLEMVLSVSSWERANSYSPHVYGKQKGLGLLVAGSQLPVCAPWVRRPSCEHHYK